MSLAQAPAEMVVRYVCASDEWGRARAYRKIATTRGLKKRLISMCKTGEPKAPHAAAEAVKE